MQGNEGVKMFAKLFEREGQQVLVTKDQDDEGEPVLTIRFKSNEAGHDISTRLAFKKDTKLDKWEVLARVFDSMDAERAFGLRDSSPGVHL
jgi:hypothetical protein